MAKRKVKTKAGTKKKVSKKVSKKASKKVSKKNTKKSSVKKKVSKKKASKKKTSKKKSKVANAKTQRRTSLIGIDPLAWLEEDVSVEEAPVMENVEVVLNAPVVNENEVVEQLMQEQSITETESIEPLLVSETENNIEISSALDIDNVDIDLGASLTIRDIVDLMAELNGIDDEKNELVFESEQLEKVDTAALQLLSGFYLFTTAAGKKVVWHKPSEALCHAAELLGLKDILNLKSVSV